MTGKWEASIHPLAQSILGWLATNHGIQDDSMVSEVSEEESHNLDDWSGFHF